MTAAQAATYDLGRLIESAAHLSQIEQQRFAAEMLQALVDMPHGLETFERVRTVK
jgi:hypothetical protein